MITLLLRRAWDEAASTIHEELITVDAAQKPTRQAYDHKVTGQTFTSTGTYEGNGTLTGDAGHWTGWTYMVTVPAGGLNIKVNGAYVLAPDNVLNVEASAKSSQGTAEFKWTLNPLDDAACTAEFSKIPPA